MMTTGTINREPTLRNDMAELPEEYHPSKDSSPSKKPKQTPKDLEAALTLLRKKDDTSRFVGLALLKPVLEQELSHENTTDEGERFTLIQRCWGAIPVKFLNRLLKARANDTRSKEEAHSMLGLAVAVMYVFMGLLESPHTDERFIGQVPLLMTILRSCPQQIRTSIIEICHKLAMTPEGSEALFKPQVHSTDLDQKPDSYLFITMLVIDIRSTIPSLQEKLHSNDYLAMSERLGRAYDIVSAFIGFLIQSLDMMSSDDIISSHPASAGLMPVDLLLKLRTNISEAMSLTIEHLRDRYDSSTAGAAGLHPAARSSIDRSFPLPIAWDTSNGIFADPLTLSQLRTLSLWLRDEENDALRKEAAGVMDVLLALYQYDGEQEFRYPVLVALEGITQCTEGVEAFLQEGGWAPLAKDLTTTLQQSSSNPALGIEIVRILLVIAESEVSGEPRQEWMAIVALVEESLSPTTQSPRLELSISVAQLAVELLAQSPRSSRKRYRSHVQKLLNTARILLTKGDLNGNDKEGLDEIVSGLSDLGLA